MNPDDRPTCTPPWAHIFLDGRMRCECGELDYSILVEVVTGKPVDELLRSQKVGGGRHRDAFDRW